jgi:hypothetical protein
MALVKRYKSTSITVIWLYGGEQMQIPTPNRPTVNSQGSLIDGLRYSKHLPSWKNDCQETKIKKKAV